MVNSTNRLSSSKPPIPFQGSGAGSALESGDGASRAHGPAASFDEGCLVPYRKPICTLQEQILSERKRIGLTDESMSATLSANDLQSLKEKSPPLLSGVLRGLEILTIKDSIHPGFFDELDLPDLKTVWLPQGQAISNGLMASMVTACPNIRDVLLVAPELAAGGLAPLAQAQGLKGLFVLRVENSSEQEAIQIGDLLPKLKGLEGLMLPSGQKHGLLSSMARHNPAMRFLHLASSGYKNDDGCDSLVSELLERFPGLESVANYVDPSGGESIQHLFQNHPWLRQVSNIARSDDSHPINLSQEKIIDSRVKEVSSNLLARPSSIALHGCNVDQKGLLEIANQLKGEKGQALTRLSLFQSRLAPGAGLSALGDLRNGVTHLDVSSSNVTDKDVLGFENVKHLRVDGCGFVNDAWLGSLANNKTLRSLMITGGACGSEAIAKLKAANPQLNITQVGGSSEVG